MPKQYSAMGMSLMYPDSWSLSVESLAGEEPVPVNPAGTGGMDGDTVEATSAQDSTVQLDTDEFPTASSAAADPARGITLESPGGSFLSINQVDSAQDVESVVREATATMATEYEDIESEPLTISIDGQAFEGTVQSFYYLDLLIVSKLLAIKMDNALYLIQIQGEDRDMEQQGIVFEAILTSMLRSRKQRSD